MTDEQIVDELGGLKEQAKKIKERDEVLTKMLKERYQKGEVLGHDYIADIAKVYSSDLIPETVYNNVKNPDDFWPMCKIIKEKAKKIFGEEELDRMSGDVKETTRITVRRRVNG